jgi:GNAT superfamily N-acetyltransferase
VTIRPATAADLAHVGPAAAAFYASSRHLRKRRFHVERFAQFWAPLLESGAGYIALQLDDVSGSIRGAIGGVVYPDPYSGDLVATEFFWFVEPQHRGAGLRLYRLFERWAIERGARELRMVHLLDSQPEQLAKLYVRLGYTPAETHYSKALTK